MAFKSKDKVIVLDGLNGVVDEVQSVSGNSISLKSAKTFNPDGKSKTGATQEILAIPSWLTLAISKSRLLRKGYNGLKFDAETVRTLKEERDKEPKPPAPK